MLQEAELLVAGGISEVIPAGQTAAFFGAERRIGQDQRGVWQRLALGAEGVAVADAAVDAVQHQVHHCQTVSILNMFHAVKGAVAVFTLLSFGEFVEVVMGTQVMIGGNQETAGAGGRVLNDVVERGFHNPHHAVDQRARRKVLAGAGFLFVGVFLQQAFVKVAQVFAVHAVPVDLVDLGHQRGKGGGLFDEAAGVGEDFLHQRRAVAAKMDKQYLVELQPIRCGPDFQIGPAMVCRELIFGAGFLGHLEEEQIGQFGDVLMISDAVILEDVAEVPELGDDVGGEFVIVDFWF